MPRMTRAKAAEVAETLHVDADQVLDLPDDFATDDAKAQLGDPAQRSPLEELTVNHETAPQALKTSHRRSKRGKRAGAVDVDDQADSEPSSLAEIADDTHATVQDEGDSTPSSVRQNAAEDPSEDVSGGKYSVAFIFSCVSCVFECEVTSHDANAGVDAYRDATHSTSPHIRQSSHDCEPSDLGAVGAADQCRLTSPFGLTSCSDPTAKPICTQAFHDPHPDCLAGLRCACVAAAERHAERCHVAAQGLA